MMKNPRKVLLTSAAIFATVAVAAALIAWLMGGPPAPENLKTAEDAFDLLTTVDLTKLPADERQEYADRLRELRTGSEVVRFLGFRRERADSSGENMSDEQRHLLRSNTRALMEMAMQERVDHYFELAESERTAYLDRIIDDMQSRFAERRQSRSRSERSGDNRREDRRASTTGEQRERPRWTAEERRDRMLGHMRERIETTDPEERAKHIEFMKAMRKRMEQRGIRPHYRSQGRHEASDA